MASPGSRNVQGDYSQHAHQISSHDPEPPLRMPDPSASPALQALRSSDSWVEISSRQSSSSLSSANTDDNAGPVEENEESRRRRIARQRQQQQQQQLQYHSSAAAPLRLTLLDQQRQSPSEHSSSQEEYEESESESDQIMTSSNEGHSSQNSSSPFNKASEGEEQADGNDSDENATALGVDGHKHYRTMTGQPADESCFTPQPNAFSHPPSVTYRRHTATSDGSYFPPMGTNPVRSSTSSNSAISPRTNVAQPMSRRASTSAQAALAHLQQADHDAALRASLTTLLSCAAAARGHHAKATDSSVAEKGPSTATQYTPGIRRVQPGNLRMVPESALPTRSTAAAPGSSQARGNASGVDREEADTPLEPSSKSRPKHSSRRSGQSPNSGTTPASPPRSARRSASPSPTRRRAAKRPKHTHSAPGTVSPTLLTWVVSAGVLVLVGALSFSAGYGAAKRGERADGWAGSRASGDPAAGAGKRGSRGSGLGLRRRLWEGVVGSGMSMASEGRASVAVGG